MKSHFRPIPLSIIGAAILAVLLACNSGAVLTPPPLSQPALDEGTGAAPVISRSTEVPLTPTPVPFMPNVQRLTEPGCCVQPFWSADSRTVLFIDKPEAMGVSGLYGVSINGGASDLVSEQTGIASLDGTYMAFRSSAGETVIREMASGNDTTVYNDGQRPFFSPTNRYLAWTLTYEISATLSRNEIYLSDLDGQNQRQVITVFNGGISGWLDDDHLLVGGRKEASATQQTLFSINLNTNDQIDIASEERMRSVRVAPGGKWILYTVTLDPTDSANDGLWVVSADGQQRYKLAVIGTGQWRDATHLVVVPLEMDAPSHRLWQFDALTGVAGAITDAAVTSFRIAGGDWAVSPDGKYLVFVNVDDNALWLMTLPPLDEEIP